MTTHDVTEKLNAPAASTPRTGSADGVISDEVENLLINIAQILDVVKTEWAEAWSPFDQEQRDHITRLLCAKRPPNVRMSEGADK